MACIIIHWEVSIGASSRNATRGCFPFSRRRSDLAELLLGIIEDREQLQIGAEEELILYRHVVGRSGDEADDHDEP